MRKKREVSEMKRCRLPRLSLKKAIKYAALAAAMLLLNFALPQCEPLSFALYFASVSCGLDLYACAALYLLSSAPALSLDALLSAAAQAALCTLIFALYAFKKRRAGAERAVFAALAQIPFVFLFPHAGYSFFSFSPILQKTVLAGGIFLLSLLFDDGLHALLFRAFRCRLSAHALAEICLMGTLTGIGLCVALGSLVYLAIALFALLFAVFLLKTSAAVPFALALSLPLAVVEKGVAPCAVFAAYACVCLLFAPYGKGAASFALFLSYLAEQYFESLYTKDAPTIAFALVACALPALFASLLPESLYAAARKTVLFYRERTLPRIAINRNRRAVGEQLYEVSALFREIEGAFSCAEREDRSAIQLREAVIAKLCAKCPDKNRCAKGGAAEGMDKLIAVGRAKGKVNLIDLPSDLTSMCGNCAGLLFVLNKELDDYRRYSSEMEAARAGRKLLAEQAHGISEILRDLALEQSEEYSFSEEEARLSRALSAAGILSTEIFLYGEDAGFTASLTTDGSVNGKKLSDVVSAALGFPLSVSEKIPLTSDRACFVLRRRANFDAAFGVAARTKEGESASGDTHSILKIDERRFLVALSDGMGSGSDARTVSDSTLTLIESFYKAKMPSETVLSTVNRLIAFSSDEMFSCLDLAAVNLDTGVADIVKIGSPVGFVLSGEELRVLEGDSLPMGALEAVHPSTMRVTMKEDDFLLFMSDGVTTAFGSSADLYSYLGELRPLNPQSLAEEVLAAALKRYGGKAQDDMTVLAVRLLKAA